MDKIDKVGAIILQDKKLLVVRKKTADNRAEYIIPGGRREKEESDSQTLSRELQEELQVSVSSQKHFGSFDDIAIFENIPIHMEVYLVTIHGEPTPASEIKEYAWIDRNYNKKGILLGRILSRYVVPKLIEQDIL